MLFHDDAQVSFGCEPLLPYDMRDILFIGIKYERCSAAPPSSAVAADRLLLLWTRCRCYCTISKLACSYVGGPMLWTRGCEKASRCGYQRPQGLPHQSLRQPRPPSVDFAWKRYCAQLLVFNVS
jgi:hypothetical protein